MGFEAGKPLPLGGASRPPGAAQSRTCPCGSIKPPPRRGRRRPPSGRRGVLRDRELLQAFAQQDVVPVLAVEGAGAEEPTVHRRRETVLDAPARDPELA